jgi:transposase
MNPWPDDRSILVLDNCRIHHNDALVELFANSGVYMCHIQFLFPSHVCFQGCILAYLPPYSPDLTPIEESYSAREPTVW